MMVTTLPSSSTMTANAYLEEPHTESKWSPLYATHNVIRIYRRIVWVICASISILSARHLLVEQNLHFPLQLYFSQLVITGLIALRSCWAWQDIQEPFRERPKSQSSMIWGTVLITISVCFMWLSTICLLQAILHFQNLPTLFMMTTIAFFAEGLILLIVRIVPPTYVEILRISLLLVAVVGLLYTEYRLNVRNQSASIPAMLLAGIARALWQTAIKYYPEAYADNMNRTGRFVVIGALVGMIWVYVSLKVDPIFALDLGSVLLLATHALASALALTLGKSMFFPIDDDFANTDFRIDSTQGRHISDALTFATLTGIVGCHSTLSIRRSYTNIYQFCCFFLAIMCISSRACIAVINDQPQRSRITHSTYELVDVSPVPSVENSDTTGFAEEANHAGMLAFLLRSRANKTLRRFVLGISLALLWTAYMSLNFTERPESQRPALLDREYVPNLPVEVVLSMYKEPVDKVSKLLDNLRSITALSDAYFTIYIKDNEADLEAIKQQMGANRIITLPNIGREGETFLNHILTRWNNLARQTIFLQADIHNPREFYRHINNYYSRNQTGYLNLGWPGSICNFENCGDRDFWLDITQLFPQIHSRIYNSTDCNNILLSYKGQFIVSAARIRGIDKDIYHSLWQAFVDENSWAHQPQNLRGRPDSMSAPDFGYTMERLWNLLFQCFNTDIGWKCPSLVSGWRIGGDIGDCQCFDE